MDLSKILSITGKGGLFKFLSKTSNSFIVEGLDDGKRFPVICSQWFLHINWFAGFHRHNGKGGMSGWWGCYVNGIDVRIVDESLGIIIPTWNVVSLRIRFCLFYPATHHGYDTRTFYFVESRSALSFRYFTTTYEAPFHFWQYFRHKCVVFLSVF